MINNVVPMTVRVNKKSKACHNNDPQLQITIPAAIRKHYNIKKGDTILMVANEKEIIIYTKEEYLRRLER